MSASPYNPPRGEPFDVSRVKVHKFTDARNMARDCAARPKDDGGPGSVLVSMAGGRKRWAVFTEQGEYISVLLINTEIMRFYPLGILFRMAGFNKVTTRSVVNNLLPAGKLSGTADGEKLFYQPPGAAEPFLVPGQELTVRYSGHPIQGEAPLTRSVKPRATPKAKPKPKAKAKAKAKPEPAKETVAA